MRKIKWGVIGCGGIARRRTIPEGIVAASNAQLAAVYDVVQPVSESVAREFRAVSFPTLKSMLASDIEAVYVASPVDLHSKHAVEAARAGKHVLCEKPLGMTVREVKNMMAFCRKKRVKLGSAFMMRFQTQHQAALAMIKAGKLGKLVYGRAQLSCWYPPIKGAWRQDPARGGGGALIDMGGHCIDLLEMFFGPVVELSCFTRRLVHGYKSEDSSVAALVFKNGALGTVDSFFCVPDNGSKNVLEIYGSKGSILCRGTIGQGPAGEMTAFIESGDGKYNAKQARAAAEGLRIAPPPANTYRAEIEEFSRAIIDRRTPSNSAELGLQSQKVLEACYLSARIGKSLKIV